ncbi:MAG: hypothetical protein ABSC22_11995 [Roseiarcus sp.]
MSASFAVILLAVGAAMMLAGALAADARGESFAGVGMIVATAGALALAHAALVALRGGW